MFKGYDNILVLSGAGFGIDAGLPDYRQLHQMAQNAAVIHNIQPHVIEDANFYKENPRKAWGIKAHVMNMFLTKKPHEGYYKLKEILKEKNSFIITSNIDDHYREAGFEENCLYEIHGRLKILQCVNRKCNQKHNLWKLDTLPKEENMTLIGNIPKCIYCGDYARPNVCFTDDNSFCSKLRDTQKAKFNDWIKKVVNKKKPKLLILEIGCGRHQDSIGMNKLDDGTFRLLSNELKFPNKLTEENIKIIRVNPDRNINKEVWEDVYYETGLEFFKKKDRIF